MYMVGPACNVLVTLLDIVLYSVVIVLHSLKSSNNK